MEVRHDHCADDTQQTRVLISQMVSIAKGAGQTTEDNTSIRMDSNGANCTTQANNEQTTRRVESEATVVLYIRV